ncbi:transmembrane protein 223 [Anoplopoma fimbria]|uniref:transmembrane protein 223 n=1 Tax=Anoplopoma fimbria TaxID=229290 RepID=UPI0023EB4927|nr:transmembrane protein 223 [Anoplopoma fimbria]
MGFERLLCGALQCYSKHFRLVNILQNASMCTQAPPSMTSMVTRVTCPAGGRLGRVFVHRQPAVGLCTAAQPGRDVTLFKHDRTRFFRLLAVFCGGQLLFWTYLGHFAYTGLRDTGGAAERDRGTAKASTSSTTTSTSTTTTGLAGIWSFEMNLGSTTWRYGFTLGCLTIGAVIVGLGVLFCRRSVSQVVLHQGGRMVTVSTQSLLGPDRGRRITVPLSQVACHAHRHESPSFIPLRVKGHKFYFLLDKDGTVNNTRLFDITVGAYRPF